MNLSYRGISYESNPICLSIVQNEFTAKYRGVTYQTRQVKSRINQPNFKLKYRGISYQSGVSFKTHVATHGFDLQSAIAQ